MQRLSEWESECVEVMALSRKCNQLVHAELVVILKVTQFRRYSDLNIIQSQFMHRNKQENEHSAKGKCKR
jgi:hypothetical protein